MSKNLLVKIFTLSSELVQTCRTQAVTIATAESCTGGLIGAAITATPGSSAVFHGGIIAYHNRVKTGQLAVKAETLDAYGAVSAEVAKEMAKGCRETLGVDLAISVTGIAGPGGGTDEKPVGTVWIGLATAETVSAKKHDFPNLSRNKVRDHACITAVETLLDALN